MKQPFFLFLAAAMLFSLLTGCASAGVERTLNAVEDQAASAGEELGRAASRAVTPAPAATPSLPAAPAETAMPTQTIPPVETTLPQQPDPAAPMEESTITQAQAESIALKDAGLTAGEATGLRTRYEVDDRIPQYDVEFFYDGWEYEYEIHAQTGKILSYDRDPIND